MASLPAEVRASYVVIIDRILAESDLNTISSKRIREGLQKEVPYDITPQKEPIKALIHERFDKFAADAKAAPVTNGHTDPAPEPVPSKAPTKQSKSPLPESKVSTKRKSESQDDDASDSLSDVPSTPPPKKKRKPELEDDAAIAARLQAEENSRARPTRRGRTQRKPPVVKKKKKKTPKKKTADKVGAEDDSEIDASGSGERKVNRNGGFHKLLNLSAPLSALLDGEAQLSRPQTVKRIWAYVKARDLQDPKDKRQIRCDDALRAVFKQEKVHMFTMNKILSTQMYDPDT
ncbi:hypothetical protein MMC10_007246 [Thelotrema lepadinum]|nr:hypothetical protein [Thelotrema lepadinum]